MGDDRSLEAGADEDGGRLMNIARGAKLVALLCFFLPWGTVTCNGRPVLTVSGADLARGHVGRIENVPLPAGVDELLDGLRRSVQPDLLLIVAAGLIVVGLAATFLLPRGRAPLAGAAAAAAAAVLIAFDVFVRLPPIAEEARARADEVMPGGGGDGLGSLLRDVLAPIADVSARPSIGLGLTLAALVAAAVLFKVVHGRRRREAAPPASGAAPGAGP